MLNRDFLLLAFVRRTLKKIDSDANGNESSATGDISAVDGKFSEEKSQRSEEESRDIERKYGATLAEAQIREAMRSVVLAGSGEWKKPAA